MRLTDLPRTPELINYLTEMFIRQDEEFLNPEHPDLMQTNVICVGDVYLKNKDGASRLKSFIYKDEALFQLHTPRDNAILPLSAIGKTKSGEVGIYINQVTYDMYFAQTTHAIALGVIAQSLAHYDCGHLDLLSSSTPALSDDPKVRIQDQVIRRLEGTEYGGEPQLKADLKAIDYVGLAPILAYQVYCAANTYHIGIGMMFDNRIHKILQILRDNPAQCRNTFTTDFDIKLLTEDEINTLKKSSLAEINSKGSV